MKNKKIVFLAVLIIFFIINTTLVKVGLTTDFDDLIHNFIFSIYSEQSTNIMNIITFFGSVKWMIALAVMLFIIYLFFNKRKSYSVASVIIISTLLNNIIKPIISRSRPLYIMVVEHSKSYPSGHMMASTSLYGLLIYFIIKSNMDKKYKLFYSIMLSILILLVGISRIYLGAHFATDIIGAFLVSSSLLITFSLIDDKYNILKD